MKIRLFYLLLFMLSACDSSTPTIDPVDALLTNTPTTFQRGLTIQSTDATELAKPDAATSIYYASRRHINFLQIVVPWYQDHAWSEEITPDPVLTPTDATLEKAIAEARRYHVRIFLNPRVLARDNCPRDLLSPLNVPAWFVAYRKFIAYYATFAEAHDVEMFSIGGGNPELNPYPDQWNAVIDTVRSLNDVSLLTFCAGWDHYQTLPFWHQLDFIGIEAFFPLTRSNDPTYPALLEAWTPWVIQMENYSRQQLRPVLFTNIGYTSQDGTNILPASSNVSGRLDLSEQAICYEVFFQTFFGKPWLYGVYWWGWTPQPSGGQDDLGYIPRNKPADQVLFDYFLVMAGERKQ